MFATPAAIHNVVLRRPCFFPESPCGFPNSSPPRPWSCDRLQMSGFNPELTRFRFSVLRTTSDIYGGPVGHRDVISETAEPYI